MDGKSEEYIENYRKAKKIMNEVQHKFGHTFTSAMTVMAGARWEKASKADDTGEQLLRCAEDLQEILTPMAS